MEQIQEQVLANNAASETAEAIDEETGVGQPPQNRQPRFDDYAESEDAGDQTAQSARGERYEVPHFGYS